MTTQTAPHAFASTSAPASSVETSRATAVSGAPRIVLRLEGAAIFAAAVFAYAQLGGGWGLFAALFLVPDLSMLGYLINRRVGAIAYNAGHSYLGAFALGAAGVVLGAHALLLAAAIWVAHIGFDRLLGYGLKYASAFGDTHLGTKGASAK